MVYNFAQAIQEGGIVSTLAVDNRSQSDFDVNLIILSPQNCRFPEFPENIVYVQTSLEKYRSPLSIDSGVLHSSYYRVSRNPSVIILSRSTIFL